MACEVLITLKHGISVKSELVDGMVRYHVHRNDTRVFSSYCIKAIHDKAKYLEQQGSAWAANDGKMAQKTRWYKQHGSKK